MALPIAMPLCRWDFMRCQSCHRLCTKLELERALGRNVTGLACPCGGIKYMPVNLPWWGWILPRVWVFALARREAMP